MGLVVNFQLTMLSYPLVAACPTIIATKELLCHLALIFHTLRYALFYTLTQSMLVIFLPF